jgi:hypothetical protein
MDLYLGEGTCFQRTKRGTDANEKEPELWRAAAFSGFKGLGVGEDPHHHAVIGATSRTRLSEMA